MNPTNPDAASLADGLRSARKYRHLCTDTLCRVAAWALERHPRERDALKAAKRKLHQVHGAYLQGLDLDRLERAVTDLPPEPDDAAVRTVCREVMGAHASAAERLPYLDQVYPALFQRLGRPDTVLDIACGLNPFAVPWMPLPPGARYRAFDIDGRLIDIADRFLGRIRAGSGAECRDVLCGDAPLRADVVLLLKAVPCLEQQQAGSARQLISRIRAESIVVSFPNRSLGGAEKGMVGHYADFVSRLCDRSGWGMESVSCPTETFYLLRRTRA